MPGPHAVLEKLAVLAKPSGPATRSAVDFAREDRHALGSATRGSQ